MAELEPALAVLKEAGYTPVAGVEPWGRVGHPILAMTSGDGSPAVVKLYADGLGEVAYESMRDVWGSSFTALPRPVDYIDGIGALIMERVDGPPLGTLDYCDDRAITTAMAVLVALHTSDVTPARRQTSASVVRFLRRKADTVDPTAFAEIMKALDDAAPPAAEPVPTHGDFCPRNLLVGPDRMVLIDWDRFRLAEAARDVGSFGAWAWGRALRAGRTPDWSMLDEARAAYVRLRPGADVDAGIPFYAATSLVSTALILASRPRRSHHVPRFLEEAHRLIG